MDPRGFSRWAIALVTAASSLLCSRVSASVDKSQGLSSDGLASAGEYYFQRHSYAQAYKLWLEAWTRQPTSLAAVLRVGELKLWVEGRDESTAFLLRAWNDVPWNLSARRELREKAALLQNLFLTDAGQSFYQQGLSKAGRGDCAAALPLYARALSYEKSHFLIFSRKGECELGARDLPAYFETLKQAFDAFPFDGLTRTRLAESLLYSKQPARVLTLLADDMELTSSPRRRVLEAVALADAGKNAKAIPKLRSLVSERAGSEELPALWFAIAMALSEDEPAEARTYFEKFRRRYGPYLGDGWDPFRLSEKAAELDKRVGALVMDE